MIAPTDDIVYAVACDDCGHTEWVMVPAGSSAELAEDDLRRCGWACDGERHACLSCNPDVAPMAPSEPLARVAGL